MNSSNQHDGDIPVLTDIIEDESAGAAHTLAYAEHESADADTDADLLFQIEEEISARITAELSSQIPILIEAALHEHLPQAVGARLQAEIMTALAATLPVAAKTATEQMVGTLALELGALLEQRLQLQVRDVVAQEFARLQQG